MSISAMIGALSVPESVRKGLVAFGAGIIAFALLVGLWRLWLANHDATLVENHEREISAEVAGKALEAERAANAEDVERRARMAERAAKVEEARRNAENENPIEARAPAGPVTRAVIDGLRAGGASGASAGGEVRGR